MLLSSLLDETRGDQPFVLLQSTVAQSILPFLRVLCKRPSTHSIVYSFLYAPSTFSDPSAPGLEVRDWSGDIPGYNDPRNISDDLSAAIKDAPQNKPLNVVIDSLETLSENLNSPSKTYVFLHEILCLLKTQPQNSQLIVHSMKPSEIASFLLQTEFSSSLFHLTAHPTSLFHYLSKEYMISPPPISPGVKFWSVFIPLSERTHEVDLLSFGPLGEGSSCGTEIVMEILTRGNNSQSRRRAIGPTLEGWDAVKSRACPMSELQALKSLFLQKQAAESTPDPTQNLSFNLNLSESQQLSRAQVPLPYAHEGRKTLFETGVILTDRPGQHSNNAVSTSGTIFYDPDSADDIDDDDPDDDLDI